MDTVSGNVTSTATAIRAGDPRRHTHAAMHDPSVDHMLTLLWDNKRFLLLLGALALGVLGALVVAVLALYKEVSPSLAIESLSVSDGMYVGRGSRTSFAAHGVSAVVISGTPTQVTAQVAFVEPAPVAPAVTASAVLPSNSGTAYSMGVVVTVANVTTGGFQLQATKADGSAFASTAPFSVAWQARA